MVLFGPSGAGKTSLLKAGVMPRLWEAGYDTVYVRALDDPVAAIQREVRDYLGLAEVAPADFRSLRDFGSLAPANPESGATGLADFFRTTLKPEDRLVVVLDQFEELFLRVTRGTRLRFFEQVAECLGLESPEVRFVLSLREDYLAELDEARELLPEVFANSYRLVNLSEDKARLAVTEPAACTGLMLAPDLVDALLKGLCDEGSVPPPQLQIVCHRLYRQCLRNPEAAERGEAPQLSRHELTLADYQALGEAKGILGAYVPQALQRLPGGQQEVARGILKVLVTSRATKAALDRQGVLEELAQAEAMDPQRDEERALALAALAGLVDLRLMRSFERGGQSLYELAHDHMAAEIATWISEADMRVKMVRELLRRELEAWRDFGKLIEPESLRIINERRDGLKRPTAEELELLFRSALAAGCEVAYWAGRAREGGVAVDEIALEGLKSDDFRVRAAAAAGLGILRDEAHIELLAKMLADLYPQVRVASMRALEAMGTPAAWRALLANLTYEVYVPAGEFIMGDDEGDSDEKPQHRVYVDAFYIGTYPVTNAEYKRYMDDVGRAFEVPAGKADHPVANVSWYQARDYAQWAGMRLLSEAEWEKAASWAGEQRSRGARERGRKRRYPWGDEFDETKCNTKESGIGDTTPVGKYSPGGDSPCGCADMAGNVWEWTSSLHKGYPYRADDGREDPTAGGSRVMRGGSFNFYERFARCASRNHYHPNLDWPYYGFRVGVAAAPSPLASGPSGL